MRRPRSLLALLLSAMLFAVHAHAAPGLRMSWDQCGVEGRVANKTFACDTNGGSESLLLSFESPVEATEYTGAEIYVEVVSADPVLPTWWHLRNAGTCRPTALTLNAAAPVAGTCDNPFETVGAGGIASYQIGWAGPNNAQLLAAVAVPQANMFAVGPGIETFVCQFILSHAKSVGTGACDGCSRPVCIALGAIRVTGPTQGSDILIQAGAENPGGGLSSVTWQGAYVASYSYWRGVQGYVNFAMECRPDASSPARHSTWGAVKSLYR